MSGTRRKPADPEPVEPVDDPAAAPRELVAEALRSYLSAEQLERLLDSALSIEKSAWGSCRKCSTRVEVSVPDAKAVVSAVSELLVQGFGRPGGDGLDRVMTVHRRVEVVCDAGHVCPECPPPVTTTIETTAGV